MVRVLKWGVLLPVSPLILLGYMTGKRSGCYQRAQAMVDWAKS